MYQQNSNQFQCPEQNQAGFDCFGRNKMPPYYNMMFSFILIFFLNPWLQCCHGRTKGNFVLPMNFKKKESKNTRERK